MPTRTAFIITVGDVLESGPPPAQQQSSRRKNNSDRSDSDSRPHSPASSTYSDAPRPRRFRKRNRMKTRVSNTASGAETAAAAAVAAKDAEPSQNGNGRRSRLHSVDQVYLANSNNNPMSPRTRSSVVKQEIDEEVSFV